MHPKTQARRAASTVLSALEERDLNLAQALSSVLDKVLDNTRAFTRELSSGTLRHRARIDWTLAPFLKKPIDKLDAPVRAALRLCCYERAWLQTPAAVAGNEYSAVMRSEKKSSAAGLVTAIARRLPDAPRESPGIDAKPASHLAIEYSHPQWLVEKWLSQFGFDECKALLQANNNIAPLSLRVNTLHTTREKVLSALQDREMHARKSAISCDAIVVENGGDPTHWPEWQNGEIIAQDEGAQMVPLVAAPQRGWRVIDCCAAPGGKTTHLAQLMKNEGEIIACDFAGRLKLVRENAERLGISIIKFQEGDFREVNAQLPLADLVLLDAPCTGTGTLRRRPDAKWRRTPEQLRELVALQRELIDAAATVVEPNGVLVYSTCSIEPEENEQQVEAFLKRHNSWRLDVAQSTLPHRDGCDGAFVARMLRADTQ
jgi:16S rRNA (cytosine967-C5)-methyltransferase